jgi:hypothetical protein
MNARTLGNKLSTWGSRINKISKSITLIAEHTVNTVNYDKRRYVYVYEHDSALINSTRRFRGSTILQMINVSGELAKKP